MDVTELHDEENLLVQMTVEGVMRWYAEQLGFANAYDLHEDVKLDKEPKIKKQKYDD